MKKYLFSIFLLGLITLPDYICGIKTIREKFFDGFQLFSSLKPNIQLRFIQENEIINNENVLSYFPNPLNNPEKCGRKGKISSHICDPSKILSTEEGDYIDALLEDIKSTTVLKCGENMAGYNIGVAILPTNLGDGGEIANKLLESWNLRDVDCNNDIIFVYLASENRAIIRWGISVEPAINIVMYPELISEIDSVFMDKPIGPAIYNGISTIRRQLKENIGPPRRLPQLLVLSIIGGLTVLGFGALVVSAISDSNPKSSSRIGRRLEAQELLNRIQSMVKEGSIDKELCPITLIDLDRTGVPYVICNKGYKYEARSYMAWMKANKCGPETDPISKAIEKNEYIVSNREDIPDEFKKIPLRLYLESLSSLYPDIITEQNIKEFMKNTDDRWILP
ncbi:putative integral membrane protein [Cryptosporidium meleagridis]|uniref:Putative integral membrane protein n=1 Tax=Cryptosporidium meleagridis TaxID=93969 RepID=A0A2P4Z5X5_9CRYT|nr:putative integral membrane protein [Cryptosporidium meleagridis]